MKQIFFSTMFLAVSLVLTAANPFPQGFESVTEPKGEYFNTKSDFATVILADNPVKEGVNTSNKVAAIDFGTVNSGIIRIDFSGTNQPVFEYPRHPQGLDELYYDVLRFKYYSAGKLNKTLNLSRMVLQPLQRQLYSPVRIIMKNGRMLLFRLRTRYIPVSKFD